jgi:hypothetical protein
MGRTAGLACCWLALHLAVVGSAWAQEPASSMPGEVAAGMDTYYDLSQACQPSVVASDGLLPPTCSDNQTWVLVAPYAWIPAIKGQITSFGQTQDVDLTLGEAFEAIGDLKGALQGHVEVGKGPQGLIFDAMLVRAEQTGLGPLGNTTADSDMTILELLAMYRLLGDNTADPGGWNVRVDMLFGGRYYQIDNGISIDLPGPDLSFEQSEEWVDLLVGTRAAVTVMNGIDGFVRGDFAGFGIGTSSTLAWNLVAGAEIANPCCPGSSLVLGYRILDIDEEKTSGGREFQFNVKMQGPFLALGFRF